MAKAALCLRTRVSNPIKAIAKRTMGRALSATRKRHAHRLANAVGTNIQNEPRNDIQNADTAKNKIGAK